MFSEREQPGGLLNWRFGRDGDLDAAERDSEIDAYDGAIAYVDHEIERLVEGVARLRPDEELLIIVTSDHGEAFGEHGFYLHGKSVDREEIHIPLVIHWPGRVPAGVRIDRPVTHASIPSTILDLISEGAAATFGDPSLVPLMAGDTLSGGWPLALSEMGRRDWVDPAFPVQHADLRALVDREWQYIASDSFPEELYSWSDVPQEHDLAGDPGLEPVLRTFREELRGNRR
jgi:arylsulfatase A-like enzyme